MIWPLLYNLPLFLVSILSQRCSSHTKLLSSFQIVNLLSYLWAFATVVLGRGNNSCKSSEIGGSNRVSKQGTQAMLLPGSSSVRNPLGPYQPRQEMLSVHSSYLYRLSLNHVISFSFCIFPRLGPCLLLSISFQPNGTQFWARSQFSRWPDNFKV